MTDRFFQALLKLLPAEFRADYGRDMTATFRAEQRAAGRGIGLVRLWLATIADVCCTAPAEHLDMLARDLGYTFRMLARRPLLTASATLTLALGIGANTAIFSVVNGVLFAPLPYPDADRVVLVQETGADDEPGNTGYVSFDRLRAEQHAFDSLSAMGGWSATLTGDGKDPERLLGARVTAEYFDTLGVRPALGRDFDPADDTPARRRQLILSDELWRRRYNSDPAMVGRVVAVSGAPYTIVGVMPNGFHDVISARFFPGAQAWTLLGYAPELPQACASCRHLRVIGRIKSGVALNAAAGDLTRIYQSLAVADSKDYFQPSALLTPVRRFLLGPVERPLLLLWGAVGVLLLMTCGNIANLLLIRASEREEEITIRRALGVTPTRLLRQLLTESLVLAAIGGTCGVLMAWWLTPLIASYGPDSIPRLREVEASRRVLAYAAGMTIVTGVVFGMAPARLLIRHTHLTRRSTAGPTAWRFRAALIGTNVMLSAVLLVGAGLLVRSFLQLMAIEPGFNPHQVLTLRVDLNGPTYSEAARVTNFYDQLTARLGALPGVASVGASTQLPLTGSFDRWGITIAGQPLANPGAAPEADRYGITAGYFAAMQIPLIRGRLLTDADAGRGAPVVVISQTMADQLWPGRDAIGQRVKLAGGPNNPFRTIVGVVGDVRHYGLHMPATTQAYMPRVQSPWLETSMTMVVRVQDGVDPLSLAAAVREQARGIDPAQPVTEVKTYDTIVAASIATRRFTLLLLASFAATALVLAIVGLYGALSYVVSQRQREIGVRVALGAGRAQIRRLVVSQGMRPVIAGLVLGLAIAWASSRLIESLLFGVTPADAVTFAAALAVIAASAVAACLLPATRAARIDPAVTLRAE